MSAATSLEEQLAYPGPSADREVGNSRELETLLHPDWEDPHAALGHCASSHHCLVSVSGKRPSRLVDCAGHSLQMLTAGSHPPQRAKNVDGTRLQER